MNGHYTSVVIKETLEDQFDFRRPTLQNYVERVVEDFFPGEINARLWEYTQAVCVVWMFDTFYYFDRAGFDNVPQWFADATVHTTGGNFFPV